MPVHDHHGKCSILGHPWARGFDDCQVFQVGSNIVALAIISANGRREKARRSKQTKSIGTKENLDESQSLQASSKPVHIVRPALESERIQSNIVISSAHYGLLTSGALAIDEVFAFHSSTVRAILLLFFASALTPLHALWTHNMIVQQPLSYGTMPERLGALTSGSRYRAFLLPTLAHTGAQLAACLMLITSVSNDTAAAAILLGIAKALLLLHTPVPVTSALLTLTEMRTVPPEDILAVPVDRTWASEVWETELHSENTLYDAYVLPSLFTIGQMNRGMILSVMKLYMKWTVMLFLAIGIRSD